MLVTMLARNESSNRATEHVGLKEGDKISPQTTRSMLVATEVEGEGLSFLQSVVPNQPSIQNSSIPVLVHMNALEAASGYRNASHECHNGAQKHPLQTNKSIAVARDPRLACVHAGCAFQSYQWKQAQNSSAGALEPVDAQWVTARQLLTLGTGA